ncbi:hypothetical protein ES702_01955 [subsurface metagenome]
MKVYVTMIPDEKDSLDIEDEHNQFLTILKFVEILHGIEIPYQFKITNMPTRPGFVRASEL